MGVDWRFERFHIVHSAALQVHSALVGLCFTIGYAAQYSHLYGVFICKSEPRPAAKLIGQRKLVLQLLGKLEAQLLSAHDKINKVVLSVHY